MIKSLKSIFIVNSDPDLAAHYAEMLSMGTETYIINMAYSGKDCLSTLKRYIPDLVLLDIEIKDMDGWDLIEKIKERISDIPLVIITARPPCLEDFLHLVKVSDYLIRPVSLDCLFMTVKDAIEIPVILNKCLENVRNSPAREEVLLSVEENIRLIKQSVIDKKIFIIMRQMYPGNSNPQATFLLNDLKRKIERTHHEIETFKTQERFLTDIKL